MVQLTSVRFNYLKKIRKFLHVPTGDRLFTTSGTRTTSCEALHLDCNHLADDRENGRGTVCMVVEFLVSHRTDTSWLAT
jgi:hypothetical protein